MNRENLRELAVFFLLLAIGVLGRWAQPAWNFTPLAAVTMLGAYYFRHLLPALLLPTSMLVVSDLLLPVHDSMLVLVSVHAMMLLPLLLGRATRTSEGWRRRMLWVAGGVLPACAFFVVTNFAVWAFQSTYAKTLDGLFACYIAGLPFFRAMLAGDVLYLTILTGCLVLANIAAEDPPRLQREHV